MNIGDKVLWLRLTLKCGKILRKLRKQDYRLSQHLFIDLKFGLY